MDGEQQKRDQNNASGESASSENGYHASSREDNHSSPSLNGSEAKRPAVTCATEIICTNPAEILEYIHCGHLLMVNSRRRNGLILCKKFYAEFAGPGAAVGGLFDEDCDRVIPVGNLSLVTPEDHEERQKSYLIRRQWIRLTQQFTDKSTSLQRAQMILNQFETYFDAATIARVPDEAFALLVGVLPHTIRQARRPPGQLKVKR